MSANFHFRDKADKGLPSVVLSVGGAARRGVEEALNEALRVALDALGLEGEK